MRLTSPISLALLGMVLLVPAGCQKAPAPEPAAAVVPTLSRAEPPASLPELKAVPEPQRVAPVPPFTLQVEPAALKITPGSSARVKVTASRANYLGPIAVELRDLPVRVTAAAATLAAGQESLEIEVTAAADAAPGPKPDVRALGTAAAPATAMASSAPFVVEVTGPPPSSFSLKAKAGTIKLEQGGRARLKVAAVRSGYQGPITVELRNLPAGVTAPKGVIPMNKDEVELELSATTSAHLGTRKDVSARGTTTVASAPPVVSPAFSLGVVKAPPPAQDFTLKVEPTHVQVKQGGKVKLTVVADRSKGYQGPITVELRNLPGHVSAGQAVIPQGKDRVSLDLLADSRAPAGDRTDVKAQAHASGGNNHKVSSPAFVVTVHPVGHPPTAQASKPVSPPKPAHPETHPKPRVEIVLPRKN